jgi:MtrB/PioB family decaheme-associated outer membrane protein
MTDWKTNTVTFGAQRIRIMAITVLCALAAGTPVTADAGDDASQPGWLKGWTPQFLVTGDIEIGGRSTGGDDDAGKFLEYRDLDSGIFGGLDLLVEDEDRRKFVRIFGANIGYDDQRVSLEAGRYGSYSIDLFYGELPHIFSTSARTLYQRPSKDEFLLPSGVQSRIAGAADPSTQLGIELSAAQPVDLGFRHSEGGVGVAVQASEAVRLFSRYRLQDRRGSRPLAIPFGSPGGTFDVFAASIDDETHQVEAGIEISKGPALFGFEYRGSFYQNDLHSMTVDNPLVTADSATAAQRGRLSLDPDNSAHALAAFASATLPVSFPARVSANFAYGLHLQDDDFLPHTINGVISSGLSPNGLPANGLDGEVHTFLADVVATGRPLRKLNLKARYRVYRYDDETDSLRFPEWVRNDDEARNDGVRSVRNDYTRQDADLTASYRWSNALKTTLGYEVEAWHRSDDRQVDDLVEHGPSLTLAWRLHPSATLRTSYEFRDREGRGYDTLAFFESKLDPSDLAALVSSGITELSSLRKFDQADRRTHQIAIGSTVLVGDRTEIGLDGGWKDVDYVDSDYGLTAQRSWHAGFDAYHQLHERVGLGLWYSYEEMVYEMDSRWRPRNFGPFATLVDDPINDWSNETDSRFHSIGARANVEAIRDRLDLEVGYQIHLGEEKLRDDAVPGAATVPGAPGGPDAGAPFTHPDVEETLQVVTGTATFRISERLKLRALYRYEDFDLDDYRTDDLGPFRGGSDIYLGNRIEDYQVHIGVLSAIISL